MRCAVALLNFVLVLVTHVHLALCFLFHVIRDPFEDSHFILLCMSFGFLVGRLQINAWNPFEDISFFFYLAFEGFQLQPDEFGQVSVQAGVHVIELLDLSCRVNMHEPHFEAAVDGSLRIRSLHVVLKAVKHSIFE